MKTLLLTTIILSSSVSLQAALLTPIHGEYKYQVNGATYTGDFVPRPKTGILHNWDADTVMVDNRFSFVDADYVGFITATFLTNAPGNFEAWMEFETPGGIATLIPHPGILPNLTYSLNGHALRVGDHMRLTPGVNRFGFSGDLLSRSGGNLQVTPVPETNPAIILLVAVFCYMLLTMGTKRR